MSKILGIDSGTGFSAVAFFEAGKSEIITNSEGARTTPSVVSFSKTGERLVGQAAARQAITNAKNTAFEFKRLMGKKFSEVRDLVSKFPYEVVEAANGDCRIKIDGKEFSPEEMTSFVLAKLKADAEKFLGEKIEKAVVTCPAYWNNDQRKAVQVAGQIAGLDVVRVISEPTAAALTFGLDKGGNKVVAVADVGCGTSDFTILEMGDGVFEAVATSGDSELGGRDYDQKIIDWLVAEFKTDTGIDLSIDKIALQRLKDEAEKAKIALSTAESIEINIPFITADATGPKHLLRTLSRAKFEVLINDLNERYTAPVKQVIADADKTITDLIIVGGTSRIPSVRAKIESLFGLKASNSVNADEAIAQGAAIQAGIIAGDSSAGDVLLLDVTPLDIGIETMGQVNTVLIPRNSTIPCKKTQVFSTAVDNQPAITVRICQGNRPMFADNKLLGSFNLDGIPPAPRGVPQEEITIDINADGIINVTAKDLGTGKDAHITITSDSGLSKEDIEKAKRDAELHAAEDEKRAALVNEKNMADGLIFAIEKALKDAGDKLTDDDKKPVNEAIDAVKEAVKTDDIDKIKAAVEALNKANEPIAKKIYGNAANNGGMPNFTAEDIEKMKNDPKFASMFGAGGPFAGAANAAGTAANASSDTDDNVVDTEVVD